MLKYRINTRQFFNEDNMLPVIDTRLEHIYSDESDKCLLVCECDNVDDLQKGTKLLQCSEKTIYGIEKGENVSKTYEFVNNHTVLGVNQDENLFTVIVDKYYKLDLSVVSTQTINTNNFIVTGIDSEGELKTEYVMKRYVYFYFNNTHFFNNPNVSNSDSDFACPEPPDDNTVIINEVFEPYKTITLYLRYLNSSYEYVINPISVDYVDSRILRIDYDIFKNLPYFNDLNNILFDGNSIINSVGNKGNIEVLIDNFLYDGDAFKGFYIDKPVHTFQIPLEQNFDTNMMQSDAIETDYVQYERKKSINKIIDMEKDVYYPVIAKTQDKNGIRLLDSTADVYKILFNFHFREHRGNDWLAEPESYWNGTMMSEGELKFIEDYFTYKNEEEQSDLLTYLNFTNGDVKYQKNKLKKSFIRLSFYDSMYLTNQHLLSYATIFLNSGEYFVKYVNNLETDGYQGLEYDKDGKSEKTNLTGIRVEREHKTPKNNSFEKDNSDAYRLSSQVVITDKYNSNASSEGFYLYLWKDNDSGLYPSDLYMKVEFNHAGYGRSIPMMMPYWDSKKWHEAKKGIKTFKEILDDWNNKTNTDGQYGMNQYLKYSYIHLKYQYDLTNNRHIYYLDDETYGDSVNFKNNTIILNLYEAKLTMEG